MATHRQHLTIVPKFFCFCFYPYFSAGGECAAEICAAVAAACLPGRAPISWSHQTGFRQHHRPSNGEQQRPRPVAPRALHPPADGGADQGDAGPLKTIVPKLARSVQPTTLLAGRPLDGVPVPAVLYVTSPVPAVLCVTSPVAAALCATSTVPTDLCVTSPVAAARCVTSTVPTVLCVTSHGVCSIDEYRYCDGSRDRVICVLNSLFVLWYQTSIVN